MTKAVQSFAIIQDKWLWEVEDFGKRYEVENIKGAKQCKAIVLLFNS